MNWSAQDYSFMARAIQLAKHGLYSTHPNPRVGCVIEKNNQIISEGWHAYAGGPHAEVVALNNTDEDLTDATVYITLEPCSHQGKTPPCSNALIERNVKTVIVAMLDPNPLVDSEGLAKLKAANIQTMSGLLEQQAQKLNPGFVKRMKKGLPYVRCKLAMSLDGNIALSNGISSWISSEQSRKDVQYLRAQSSAILTSVNTVIKDDPQLTVRLEQLKDYQPLRVILDSDLTTPIDAKLFSIGGKVVICTTSSNQEKKQSFIDKGIEVISMDEKNGKVDIISTLKWLAEDKEINEVLVEAGSELSGAMIEQNLVDELIVYQANILLGNKAKNLVTLPDLLSMDEGIKLQLKEQRYFGNDQKMIFTLS